MLKNLSSLLALSYHLVFAYLYFIPYIRCGCSVPPDRFCHKETWVLTSHKLPPISCFLLTCKHLNILTNIPSSSVLKLNSKDLRSWTSIYFSMKPYFSCTITFLWAISFNSLSSHSLPKSYSIFITISFFCKCLYLQHSYHCSREWWNYKQESSVHSKCKCNLQHERKASQTFFTERKT